MKTHLLPCAALLVVGACGAPAGKFVTEEEIAPDYRQAGIRAYNQLSDKVWAEMEEHVRIQGVDFGHGRRKVALASIKSRGSEELGEYRTWLEDGLTSAVFDSQLFSMIDSGAVKRVLQEIGSSSAEDLLIPRYQHAFVDQLSQTGQRPDYLLFGVITTATSEKKGGAFSSDVKYRQYRLSLRLVDANTLELVCAKTGDVTKAYTG